MRKCRINRTYGSLSSEQRRRSPYRFALWLLQRVVLHHHTDVVAVLWTCPTSVYFRLWPLAQCWGEYRDARRYVGPWPVIAHPPCGPWGCLKAFSKESREHGVCAMEMVHRWGGVVEQPLGSSLFREYGSACGRIERVDQCDYGHLVRKRTLLYWVR